MSGGGGNTTTVQKSDPWAGAQPYLTDALGFASDSAYNPPQYYPGPTSTGPTTGQLNAFDTRLGYSDQVFGGANAPRFGEATGAVSNALTGNTGLSKLSSRIGGIDTAPAFNRALSGTPDYAGLSASIDAANAPILRQFNEDILPGLNQRASFLGNPTGGIKTLNRVLPELGQRMSQNATTITEAERQRALGEQTSTAQYLTSQAGNLASNDSSTRLGAASQFPGLVQLGAQPGQLATQFGDFGAQQQQQQLDDQRKMFEYYQNLPYQTAQQYAGLVSPLGGLGQVNTSQLPPGNRSAGALGGAATGAAIGAQTGNPYGVAAGAIIGGLGGYFL